jgi:hypothetical protein
MLNGSLKLDLYPPTRDVGVLYWGYLGSYVFVLITVPSDHYCCSSGKDFGSNLNKTCNAFQRLSDPPFVVQNAERMDEVGHRSVDTRIWLSSGLLPRVVW